VQKLARNPMRSGMIIGFLGVPLLWMAGTDVVRLVLKQGILPAESFWDYEASGALVGALLGGQAGRIWASLREGNIRVARAIAFVTGAVGTACYVAGAALNAGTSPYFLRDFAWTLLALLLLPHLPFLLCLLFLVCALFAPRR